MDRADTLLTNWGKITNHVVKYNAFNDFIQVIYCILSKFSGTD